MSAEFPIAVTTFYHFSPLTAEQLDVIEADLHVFAERTDLCGLIISALEGLNSTLAGSDKTVDELKSFICNLPGFANTIFKDSRARKSPFRRFKIKRRDEIVTLKRPDVVPKEPVNNHLPPREWHRVLQEEDVVVIDTRNGYEVELGRFRGAIDPEIHQFSEFGEYVDRSGIPKSKKVLMYCTGGIRCEKAIFEMRERGYEEVYQLEGGILNYLKEFPDGEYEGECFVFDHRVAVDQHLMPTERFGLCPHCGDPGDKKVVCQVCDTEKIVCEECLKIPTGSTCSKNCAYHYGLTASC